MPQAMKTPCRHPGCGVPCRGGYCAEHQRDWRVSDRRRGTAADRGYDDAWKKVAQLRRELDAYLCQVCLNEHQRLVPSNILDHSECYAGLDLSSTRDIAALVLVFRKEEHYAVLPFFWVPEEGARQRERRDHVPYVEWIRQGYIEATPGEVIDYERIRRKINELGKIFKIREIAIDRWNATQLATQLNDDGFDIVAFGQGYASMNWPTKMLEEVILGARLSHGGHPVLRWMAGNVSIETDAADNWKPSKKKSVERIDGIVALIMALDRAGRQEGFKSIYNTPGMLYLGPEDE